MERLQKIEFAFENSMENPQGKYVFAYDFDMDKWEFENPFEVFGYELSKYGLSLEDRDVDIDGNPYFTISGDKFVCLRDILMVEDSEEAIALYGDEYELQGVYTYVYYHLMEDN